MGIIYEVGDTAAEFSDRLKAAFDGVETMIQPHLKL